MCIIVFVKLKIWETKLNATKVFQNIEDQAAVTTSPTTGARLPITSGSTQSSTATTQSSVQTALNALPQSLQQQHQLSNETQKIIVKQQIDGNNDIDSSDEDEEDTLPTGHLSPDGYDDEEDDNFTKANDEGNDEGREDSDPLNSSDDVSEHDPNEIFDVDNVIICQYEKLTRIKTRWKFHLKDGVMNINGKDYLFIKATGEADW